MEEAEISAITRKLITTQNSFEEVTRRADNYREYVASGTAIDLNSLGTVKQYKEAQDEADALALEVKRLINELEAGYPQEIIWASKKLQLPIFLLRNPNRRGFYALIPSDTQSLTKSFKVDFIQE